MQEREKFLKHIFGLFDRISSDFSRNLLVLKNSLFVNSILYVGYGDEMSQRTIEKLFLPLMGLNEDPEPSLGYSIELLGILQRSYLDIPELNDIIDFIKTEGSIKIQTIVYSYLASIVCKIQLFLLTSLTSILPNFSTSVRIWCLHAFYAPNVRSKMSDKKKHAISILEKYRFELPVDFIYQPILFLSDMKREAIVDSRKPQNIFLTQLIIMFLKRATKERSIESHKLMIKILRKTCGLLNGKFRNVLKRSVEIQKMETPDLILTLEEATIAMDLVLPFLILAVELNDENLVSYITTIFQRIYGFCDIDIKYKAMSHYLVFVGKLDQSESHGNMMKFLFHERVFMIDAPCEYLEILKPLILQTIHRYEFGWTKVCVALNCKTGQKYDDKINFIIKSMTYHKNHDTIKAILIYLLDLPNLYSKLEKSTLESLQL